MVLAYISEKAPEWFVPLRNAANCVIFEVYQIVKRNGNSVIRVELILAVLQIGLRGKRRYAIVLARPSV